MNKSNAKYIESVNRELRLVELNHWRDFATVSVAEYSNRTDAIAEIKAEIAEYEPHAKRLETNAHFYVMGLKFALKVLEDNQ